jgi:hypothetical protein
LTIHPEFRTDGVIRPAQEQNVNSWIFQANPSIYRIDIALRILSEHTWLTNQHAKHIKAGDEAFIWRCGDEPAMVAVADVLTDPALLSMSEEEQKFEAEPLKFDGKRMRVKVRTRRLEPPIPRYMLLKDPALSQLAIFRGWTGTNFALKPEAAAAIHNIADSRITT